VKTCESAIASDGTINVLIGTFKKMRTDQIENAINQWNDGQSSKQMQISIQHVFGYNTIDTFGKDIGTRASDHPFVWAIGTARDNKNPSYHFWRSSDPSNAQISSKKQKTTHSARQTTMEEALVDKHVAPSQEGALVDERPIVCATFVSVAPESVMVDVPATLLSVEVAEPVADQPPAIPPVAMAEQPQAIPPVDEPPVATADPAELQPDATPSEEDILADAEAMTAESVDAPMTIANYMKLATGIMVDIREEILFAQREMLRFKLTNLKSTIANKDELLASKDVVIASKDVAYADIVASKDAVIAAQAASHEAAMTARQASIDALTVSNERLRGALAAFMA